MDNKVTRFTFTRGTETIEVEILRGDNAMHCSYFSGGDKPIYAGQVFGTPCNPDDMNMPQVPHVPDDPMDLIYEIAKQGWFSGVECDITGWECKERRFILATRAKQLIDRATHLLGLAGIQLVYDENEGNGVVQLMPSAAYFEEGTGNKPSGAQSADDFIRECPSMLYITNTYIDPSEGRVVMNTPEWWTDFRKEF